MSPSPLLSRPLAVISLLSFALLFSPPTGLAENYGTTSGEILKLPVGARAVGMGEAQTALPHDLSASHWNPAGLGTLSSPEISLMHHRLYEDVQQYYALVACPLGALGTPAVGFNHLTVESFQGFDAQGTPTRPLESRADAASLSWGKNLFSGASDPSGLFGGLTFKFLQEEHADVSASGLATDVGFLYRPPLPAAPAWGWVRRTSLGLAVKNLGQGPKFDTQTPPLPTEITAGVAYSHFLEGDILHLALDVRKNAEAGNGGAFGVEYGTRDLLALRAGFVTTRDRSAGLRLGAGFRLRRVRLDYAWSANGDDLDASHRLSLTFQWGTPSSRQDPVLLRDVFNDHLAQGKKWMELGAYDRAVLQFQQALEARPGDPEAHKLLLDCGKRMETLP
ncbi:MAG TPA: PorV/PorQ family protein [Elusimicrobiota bacterium]|nr:PorV/PorQ family protein [Elusimicrobiota bacterium]